jgi:hypothetical protein
MKKITLLVIIPMIFMGFTISKKFGDGSWTGTAYNNYTGAPRADNAAVRYCTNCHGDFTINTVGGSVMQIGLPATYTPGTAYPFTVVITHSASDRLKWGFSIKAVNTTNNFVVGTFSTTNPGVVISGTQGTLNTQQTREMHHSPAANTAATNSYTFVNLKWTAPAVPTVAEQNIKFYVVGVAADGSTDETGDYVYNSVSTSSKSTLPITLINFNAKANPKNEVTISWQTEQEINASHFDIETSADGTSWKKITTLRASGNSSTTLKYDYLDTRATRFNGTIYYRLKSVDIDGSSKYSDIRPVFIKNESVIIYNLSNTLLQKSETDIYSIHSPKSAAIQVRVIDANARLLYTTTKNISVGENIIEIPNNRLTNSNAKFYIVEFSTNDFKKSFTKMAF